MLYSKKICQVQGLKIFSIRLYEKVKFKKSLEHGCSQQNVSLKTRAASFPLNKSGAHMVTGGQRLTLSMELHNRCPLLH